MDTDTIQVQFLFPSKVYGEFSRGLRHLLSLLNLLASGDSRASGCIHRRSARYTKQSPHNIISTFSKPGEPFLQRKEWKREAQR